MTVKKASILITILAVVGGFLIQLKPRSTYQTKTIEIGNQKLQVEIADSPGKRAIGLGKRDNLEVGTGMLFNFPYPSKQQIWMKDMRFPIDIIWIEDGVVVDLATNIPAPTTNQLQLPIYTPKEKANQVLEVEANFTVENKIKVGDKVKTY